MGDLSWAQVTQLGGSTLSASEINSSIDYYRAANAILYNTHPSITSTPTTNLNQGETFYYFIQTYDPDITDLLTVSVGSPTGTFPDWLYYNAEQQYLYGTAGNENVGDHTIEIILSDDKGGYDAQLFTLTVNNINDAPVFDLSLIHI